MANDEKTEHDVAGLLRKNSELLAEVRSLKQRLSEAEGALDAAQAETRAAQAAAQRVVVEEPLEAAMASRFLAPWRVVRSLLNEHFDIAATDDGLSIARRGVEGDDAAVSLDALFDHVLEIPDLAMMLVPERGGGAKGVTYAPQPRDEGDGAPRKVANPFGLR